MVTVVCSLAFAACGEQIAAHVQAGDTVHSALTSLFNNPTTRFVVTGQNLPGRASIADGSFSIVVTTSRQNGASLTSSSGQPAVDLSIYHQSTNLVDLRSVNGSDYFRVDLKDIAAFDSPSTFATISTTLEALADRPGLGYLHDILLGKWVGVSTKTLLAAIHLLTHELGARPSTTNLQAINGLRTAVATSFVQSIHMWLSIHQEAADEYSLSLPIRHFAGSFLEPLVKPLAEYLNQPLLSRTEIQKVVQEGVAKIPATLFVHANMWVTNGSTSKLQIFLPHSSASILIGVSHPAEPVQAPSNATMLTVGNLTALFGTLRAGGLGGTSSVTGIVPAF